MCAYVCDTYKQERDRRCSVMGVEEWSGLLDGQWVVYGSPVQKCCGLGARGVGAHGLGSRVPFKVGMARVVKSGRGK